LVKPFEQGNGVLARQVEQHLESPHIEGFTFRFCLPQARQQFGRGFSVQKKIPTRTSRPSVRSS
jgi:hypothetical protein